MKHAQISFIIENLMGTCKTVEEVCNEYGLEERDLAAEDFDEIDNSIFLCADCGWWYDLGEQGECDGDDTICEKCYEDY